MVSRANHVALCFYCWNDSDVEHFPDRDMGLLDLVCYLVFLHDGDHNGPELSLCLSRLYAYDMFHLWVYHVGIRYRYVSDVARHGTNEYTKSFASSLVYYAASNSILLLHSFAAVPVRNWMLSHVFAWLAVLSKVIT